MISGLSNASARIKGLSRLMLSRFGIEAEVLLLLLAAAIAVLTAGAAVAFHELIELIRRLLYVRLDTWIDMYGRGVALLVALPALGGLCVGIVTQFIVRAREGHGIVDVLESVVRSRGYVRPMVAVEKILTAALTIGSGGSAGAEGPIVQIGAAIASGVGQVTPRARPFMPLLVGCGSAAGISAIFNAPFGGVLFTLEVILQEFSLRTFTPVVLASVIANVTTQAIFQMIHHASEYQAIFAMPSWRLGQRGTFDLFQMPSFILLGILCGVIGVVLIRAMYFAESQFARLRLPRVFRPALGGAMLGFMGVAYVIVFGWLMFGRAKPFDFAQYPMPAFFGDGYGVVRQFLDGAVEYNLPLRYILVLLCSLCLLKIVGTCLTLGSGGSGGIIAPSLFIGSVVGTILGLVLQSFGWRPVQSEVYALVGMGAVLAAVVHAPLASILIVFELTRDEKVIPPAMLACVLSAAAARFLFRDSIYTLALRQRGVRLGTMADLTLLRRLSVDQVPLEAAPAVHETDELRRVLELMAQQGEKNFIVLDAGERYCGIIVAEDVHTALLEPDVIPLLLVSDIARWAIPAVRSADDLASVLDAFVLYDIDHLPVVAEGVKGPPQFLISRAALLRYYQQGLAQRT